MTIAEILNAERESQSLSVNELARRANTSVGRVHAILRGEVENPRIDTLQAILDGLDKTLTWLDTQRGAH